MATATGLDLPELPQEQLTADEFETWAFAQELFKCEWVEGKIVVLAPATVQRRPQWMAGHSDFDLRRRT